MLKLPNFNLRKSSSGAPFKRQRSQEEKALRKEKQKRLIKKYVLPILGLCFLTMFLFCILVIVVSTSMSSIGKKQVITLPNASVSNAEQPFDCILVLGAGLRPDGSPSDMLHDRVVVGVELYHALGGVSLLMSGDQTGDYNEVAAMKSLAMSLGVPEEDIFLDPKGYSTYESMIRAREVFGVKKVLIVTQEYHLYRALYLARSFGMETYGISADIRTYRGQSKREVREILARFKDLFEGAKKDHPEFSDPTVSLKDTPA